MLAAGVETLTGFPPEAVAGELVAEMDEAIGRPDEVLAYRIAKAGGKKRIKKKARAKR